MPARAFEVHGQTRRPVLLCRLLHWPHGHGARGGSRRPADRRNGIGAVAANHAWDLAPPWSLTASDGSGLVLSRVEAKAVFEGPLAFTELHLYFHNPEDRRREGTFQIALPAHAAVSRFAMENDGQWMEAEVVEKQLARRAYDDFLHRRQDPALLEKAEGNQFTAKVFPIAPNSDKHIVISYSQALPGAQYMLPLRGLPQTDRVDVALAITGPDGKRTNQQLAERNWEPDRDFISNVGAGASAVTSGTLVAAQIVVGSAGAATDTPTAITMLVDTSASRGLGYEAYVQSVRALIGKLRDRYGAALALDVIAFDQDTEHIFTGRAADWSDAQDKQLVERGAAGASDLGQALASLRDRSRSRVVIVTDGMITAGIEHGELAAAVKKLAHVDRLDVVLAGGLRDDQAATELVRAGLPHAGRGARSRRGHRCGRGRARAAGAGSTSRSRSPVRTWVYPRRRSRRSRAGTSSDGLRAARERRRSRSSSPSARTQRRGRGGRWNRAARRARDRRCRDRRARGEARGRGKPEANALLLRKEIASESDRGACDLEPDRDAGARERRRLRALRDRSQERRRRARRRTDRDRAHRPSPAARGRPLPARRS